MDYFAVLDNLYRNRLVVPLDAGDADLLGWILHLWNASGRPEQLTISQQRILAMTGGTPKTLRERRNRLSQKGYLDFDAGNRREAPVVYRLGYLLGVQSNLNGNPKGIPKSNPNGNPKSNPTYIKREEEGEESPLNIPLLPVDQYVDAQPRQTEDPLKFSQADEQIRQRLGRIFRMPNTLQWSHAVLTAYLARRKEITLEHLALIERYYAAPRNPKDPSDRFRRNTLHTLLDHWEVEVGHATAWEEARTAKGDPDRF